MAGKDIIIMSKKELKRVPVVHNVINNRLTQREAADILGLSTRQVRRIIKDIKEEGEAALVHRSRGKPSNRAKPSDLKNKILTLCNTVYKSFNPTFAAEKLFERDKLKIHPETLRLWLIEAGLNDIINSIVTAQDYSIAKE